MDGQPGPVEDDAAFYPRPAHAAGTAASPARRALSVLQFVAGGLGGGLLAVVVLRQLGRDALPTLAGLSALGLLMVWLQVVVHEAGHALAGIAVGRRLVGAGLGPLRLERGTGGWRLRWGGGVRGIGGFAALVPGDGRGAGRRADILFLLGGPAANLLVAFGALALLWAASPSALPVRVALGATAFGGVLLGLVNLLPFRSHGWRSDGRALLDAWRDTPLARIGRLQQQVVGLSLAGIRPRDWPLEALAIPDGLPPEAATPARLLRLSWALDRGEHAIAAEDARALAVAHASAADGQRQGIALMLAVHAVQARGDRALLAAWRPLCEGGLLDLSPYRLWLDAEAALLDGDVAAARALAGRAGRSLPRLHDPASERLMRERLEGLDARIDAAVAPVRCGAVKPA